MSRGDSVIRSTVGGQVSRSMVYMKMLDHLREAADCMAIMAHLQQSEGQNSSIDGTLAKGWLGMHELVLRLVAQVTKLAQNKLQ